jgi:phage tail-like protein
MAGSGSRVDPLASSSFWLSFGDKRVLSFQEVSGIKDETEVQELLQTGQGGQKIKIKSLGAQRQKSGKITAKYAALRDDPLRLWRQEVKDGHLDTARRNFSIVLYDHLDVEVARYNFENGWISSYAISNLTAKGTDFVTITVEIEYENMRFGL